MKRVTTLDASQISAWLVCPTYWKYAYGENLRLPGVGAEALNKGTCVHAILEIYYKLRAWNPEKPRLMHAQVAIEAFNATDALAGFNLDKDFGQLLTMRFMQYIHTYPEDITPIVNNGVPSVELGFSKVLYEDDEDIYIVEGKIDLLGWQSFGFEKILVFADHKSQSKADTLYKYRPQFLTYAWATGLDYMVVNYFGLQKEKNDKTFRRDIIKFPQWKVNQWQQAMIKVFNQVRASKIAEFYPQNFESCGGTFSSHNCIFAQLCETETDEMKETIKKFNYQEIEPWKPWKLGD